MGVFVMSLYDLSLVDDSYNAVFWVWLVFPRDTKTAYMTENSLELMNAKSSKPMFFFNTIKDSKRWVTIKYNAVLMHNWNMTDFPFDRQLLKIELEEAEHDAKRIRFIPDRINSGIDSMIKVPGWKVDSFSIESHLDINETTYGDPSISERSTYPESVVTITLKREGLRLLFNLLTAAYVAFILAMMVLFLHPEYVDARKVVLTSAMITIIGNHYIISATLPEMPEFTLIDRIMVTTFIAICLVAFFSVLTSHYVRAKKTKTAVRINSIGRWSILVIYIALNAFFYIRALT
ncbi:MAG: hypothetical protein JW765_08385 [Deltaproteobacteria bacterium]|nr:hypothetical protein [Candidatus Zymogenaceae bacterium]